MTIVRVAFLHLAPSWRDLQSNRRLIERGVTTAAPHGATWILTPELCICGYDFTDALGTAWIVPPPDPWTASLCQRAAHLGVTVFLSHPERDTQTGQCHNTLFVIGADGCIVGKHRKIRILSGAEGWSSPGAVCAPHTDRIVSPPPGGETMHRDDRWRSTTQRGRRGRGRWHSQGKRRKGHAVLDAWLTSQVDVGRDRRDTLLSAANAAGTVLSSASSAKVMPILYITPDSFPREDGGYRGWERSPSVNSGTHPCYSARAAGRPWCPGLFPRSRRRGLGLCAWLHEGDHVVSLIDAVRYQPIHAKRQPVWRQESARRQKQEIGLV